MRAIYGKKLMMTRMFDKAGKSIPVTVLKVAENIVTCEKTPEKDGYSAIQIGSGIKRHINKPEQGHLAKAKAKSAKLIEFRTARKYNVGDKISLDIFEIGEDVNVTGVSKGKGFMGTVRRHNFRTGPKTHGSNNYRQPGSIGDTGPQRVVKGRRMAGHMGAEKVTVKNLAIIEINREKDQLILRGAVPGPNKSGVLIWSKKELEKEEADEA